jgi:hypothetical protein
MKRPSIERNLKASDLLEAEHQHLQERFRMKTRCVIFPTLLVVSLWGVRAASAQAVSERVEIAASLSLLRLSDFGATNAGVGGRVSFDLTKWTALDGEVNFFPHDRIENPESNTSVGPFHVASDRSRTDALFGVRVGARTGRFGAFVKARPGVTRLSDKGPICIGPGCAVVLLPVAKTTYGTEFAFDFGGGIELYPTARTVARVDLGDTMIRHRSDAPPCQASQCTSHNFSSRFGLGYRF